MNPDRFPGIKRAALAIVLDNGGINRYRTESRMYRELGRFLSRQPEETLATIDAWLTSLTDEEFSSACSGAAPEDMALLQGAPPFTNDLLDAIFEKVC